MTDWGEEELSRLAALRRTGLLDSAPEVAYDVIVELARDIVDVPIALVSLVDADRQWFKAKIGLDAEETPRDVAFCDEAIRTPDAPLVVEDALADVRFAENPLVIGEPGIRFYAGFPILDESGRGLGTLCVIDRQPRRLRPDQTTRLRALADVVQELIRLRALANDLDDARHRAALFEQGFDRAGIGMQLVDRAGRILRTNAAFAAMIGRPLGDVLGRHWRDFAHPDAADAAADAASKAGGTIASGRVRRYLHGDGHTVWTLVNVVPVSFDESTEPINYVQITDVTDKTRAQQTLEAAMDELHRSESRLQSLIEPSPDPVLLLSAEGTIEAMNPAAVTALSATGVSLVGHQASALAVEGNLFDEIGVLVDDAVATGRDGAVNRVWFERADGRSGWYRVRVLPVIEPHSGRRSAFVNAVDVTEAVENEQRLAALALVDTLTGAANRAALYDRLDLALSRLERGASKGVGLAMIDLDHFKALNDTYGHDTGDAALVAVVDSMRSVLRLHDTVARLGGDEFIVMFDDVGEAELTQILAPRVVAQFERAAVALARGSVRLSGSVGVAWTSRRLPGRDLIAQADTALLQAKRHGRSQLWLASDVVEAGPFASEVAVRRDLESALARQQFSLRYQPIVDRAGQTTAVEALLRWEHPEHGSLLPGSFLGVLVETGLVVSVGQWVLRQAVADAARINRANGQRIAMHVNLSPGEVASTQIRGFILGLLREHDLDPSLLVIEVTERTLTGAVVSTSAVDELVSTQIRLALDDFGTDSSTLGHLRHRQLHGLKLDISVVKRIADSERERAIVSGTIAIATGLGLDVVAEGVETEQQHQWLLDAGCTHFQGWLTGRPARMDELEAVRSGG